MTAEIVDFDKEFNSDPPKKAKPIKIKMFDREWDFLTEVNAYTVVKLGSGDTAAISDFITNSVVPEQRSDWGRALAAADMDTDKLLALTRRIVEVVAERPTKSPSGSASSGAKTTSGRKSTVGSSSGRVTPRAT